MTIRERKLPAKIFQSEVYIKKYTDLLYSLLHPIAQFRPAVKNLKQILMEHRSLIDNQPLQKTIFTTPPIISYNNGKFFKDMLVRAKI